MMIEENPKLDAKRELGRSIQKYLDTQDDEEYAPYYCESWVIVAHVRSTRMENEDTSMVKIYKDPEVDFVKARGLIEIAKDSFTD